MDSVIIPFQFEEIIDLEEDRIVTSANTTDITPFTFFTTSGDSLAKSDRSDFEKWKADHGIEPIIIESPPKDSKINKPPSYWTQKMDPPIVSEQVNDTPSTINQEATVEQENDTSVDANINEQENFDKEVEDRTSLDKECEIGDVNVDDSVSHRESSFPQEATFDKKSDSGFNHSLRSNIENIKGKEVEVIDLVDSDSDDISTNIAAAMEDVSILRNQRVQQHSNNNRTSVNDDQYLVLNGRYGVLNRVTTFDDTDTKNIYQCNEDFDEVMEFYDKQFVPTVVVAEQKTLRTRYVNHSSNIKVLENQALKKQRFCTDEDDSERPLSSKDITSIVDSRSEVDSCVKRRLTVDSLKASTKTQEAEDEFIMVVPEGNDFPYSKSPFANNITNKGLEALSEKESDDESVIVVNPCTGEEEYWTPKLVGQPSVPVSRNYSNIIKKRALSYRENREYASPIIPISSDPSNTASQEANFLSSTSSSIQITSDSNSICDSDSTLSCNASPSSDAHCGFPPPKSNILFKTSPWTPDEDKLLIDAVLENLSPPWTHISRNTIQNRSDDSCRHRWARLRRRLYGSA